jgi:hypothetical protein
MELPDCGDNSCMFADKKTGMRTNGGCRCFDEIAPRGPDSPSGRLLLLARQLAQQRRVLLSAMQQASVDVLEARRVARTLAEFCNEMAGASDLSDILADDPGTYDAYQTALAYPDTTKEPET